VETVSQSSWNASIEEMPPTIDHLLFCSSEAYDPGYWIPVLHYNLQLDDNFSMRQLANCGMISMAIASLIEIEDSFDGI
jgi:hypothetical protein